ncbi:MAG: murein biosynthesis integral membrane protein MurJ [Gemmatimonadetes bacterium]|nr:murein biosynthesis integral membrane protein MurJ [Gemmatimonadota bacterium]
MPPSQGRLAGRVAAGIIVARILGFVRERFFAHYFGNGPAADAFRAALKIPNVLRVLLGEGTLSASFIPVYAAMIERGDRAGARTLAGTIASILVLVTAVAALAGVVLAPVITDFAAPGFAGPTRDLTVRLVEILFPMSGVLILSAWCLGVLNTHGRFFLSYAAPAMWNVAQIAVLVGLGARLGGARLVVALAWGALAGSALQVLLQLPATLRLTHGISWSLRLATPGVRLVLRSWGPVVIGAGVVQISSVVDTQLGSLLGGGAVAALGYAQLLATLPLSLFGVSVAAAALPDLSRDASSQPPDALRSRLAEGLRRLAFYVVPSAFALAALGRPMVAAIFQTGSFGAAETDVVTGVVAAYAVGVPGQAAVKLLASGHYALGDTRTPMRVAGLSVVLSAALGWTLMRWLGVAGIALGAAAGGYLNVGLNYAGLERRVGTMQSTAEWRALATTLVASLVAAAGGVAAARSLAGTWPGLVAGTAAFGVAYAGVCLMLRHPDATGLLRWTRR